MKTAKEVSDSRSEIVRNSGMLAGKGGDLASISAHGHGTPAAAVRARLVVEEKAAMGIGAQPEPCPSTLGNHFRRGSGDGCEEPVQAAFARDEFDAPRAVLANQFVVAFGDAEDFVDGFRPVRRYLLLSVHGGEYLVKRGAEPLGLSKQPFGGLRIGLRESKKLGAPFRGDDPSSFQEENEPFPGDF